MRWRRWAAGALVTALAFAAVAPAVSATPSINSLSLSADAVAPGTPITANVVASQATSWRLEIFSECGGASLRTINGISVAPQWSVDWEGLDTIGAPLPVGAYRLRVTPVDGGGAALATAMERTFTVGDAASSLCRNVELMPNLGVFVQGLQDLDASRAAAAVITSGADAGYAAIASSYAHRFRLPLILLEQDASSARLVKAMAKRQAKAVLIGPSAAVSTAIERALKAKVNVVRLAGADRAETAALIARRIRPRADGGAVFVPLGGNPALVAVASAYANARSLPILAAGSSLPRHSADVVAALQLQGGVAVGEVSDSTLALLPGVSSVSGRNAASVSFVLLRSLPMDGSPLVVDSATQPDVAALIQRARLGEPQWLLGGSEPSTAQRAWLTARHELESATVTTRVSRSQAVTIGRIMADRGVVGALPALLAKPAPALAVPAQFTFSGSGFGHGVGMSQWGAYGMAKESYTATAILQHYFTGSVVAPIRDDVELNVSLDSRVQSASFRLEKLGDPSSTLEMTAADGSVTTLAVGDVVKTAYRDGSIAVAVSGAADVAPFSTSSIRFRWAGNRDTGTASGGPALLRVAGPGVSIQNGARYRFGVVEVSVAKLSGGLALGLQVNNILRLHDEYLYGIAEVGSSWPMAALQTEIIAARSYAFRKYKAGIRSACACHLYDDPRDQNFTGYAKLAEKSGNTDYGARWKSAVDSTASSATHGQALMVGGSVVSAYYSAASGGMTQNNEDVWGGSPLAYTRSVADPWSLTYASASVSRWVPRAFSQATVAAAFGAPDVAYLDLSARYASGAVDSITAVTSSGARYVLGAETFKSRLNRGLADAAVLAKGIPSVWMWRVDTEIPTWTAAAAAVQVAAGSTSIAAKLPAATATTAVIVQASAIAADPSLLTLAAAFAGAERYALLVNSNSTLDAVLKADLTRRKASRVVFVGPVPAGLRSAVLGLKIAADSFEAGSPASLSALLASRATSGAPIVVAASGDERSAALAVSLASRLRRPLLFIDSVMSSEVSAFLMRTQPSSTLVVGTADKVPDAAVAGIGLVHRLTTGDPVLASMVADSQVFDSATVALVLANPLAPTSSAVIAAATGLPFLFVADTVPAELLALMPRLPQATLLFRVGVDSSLIAPLRRA